MVSNKLKIFWQNLGCRHVPWQLRGASAVTLLHPLELLWDGWARDPSVVEETLKQYWISFFTVSIYSQDPN